MSSHDKEPEFYGLNDTDIYEPDFDEDDPYLGEDLDLMLAINASLQERQNSQLVKKNQQQLPSIEELENQPVAGFFKVFPLVKEGYTLGGRIILPVTFVQKYLQQDQRLNEQDPLIFEIGKTGTTRLLYLGLLEMCSEPDQEQIVTIPNWAIQYLKAEVLEPLQVCQVRLPKATGVKIRPNSPTFFHLPDYKELLENHLSQNFVALQKDLIITLPSNTKAERSQSVTITGVYTEKGEVPAACILNVDLAVQFESVAQSQNQSMIRQFSQKTPQTKPAKANIMGFRDLKEQFGGGGSSGPGPAFATSQGSFNQLPTNSNHSNNQSQSNIDAVRFPGRGYRLDGKPVVEQPSQQPSPTNHFNHSSHLFADDDSSEDEEPNDYNWGSGHRLGDGTD